MAQHFSSSMTLGTLLDSLGLPSNLIKYPVPTNCLEHHPQPLGFLVISKVWV